MQDLCSCPNIPTSPLYPWKHSAPQHGGYQQLPGRICWKFKRFRFRHLNSQPTIFVAHFIGKLWFWPFFWHPWVFFPKYTIPEIGVLGLFFETSATWGGKWLMAGHNFWGGNFHDLQRLPRWSSKVRNEGNGHSASWSCLPPKKNKKCA